MEPYENLTSFLHVMLWVGLVVYFLTSSDSGSMTDDIISASGLSSAYIPSWQKIFWCWTEGFIAIALVTSGTCKSVNAGLKTLQAASIIIGLPYTVFLCLFVPSLYRVLKKEAGDQDIAESNRFNTQILDCLEGFHPNGGSPYTPSQHLKKLGLALFVPGLGIKAVCDHANPADKIRGPLYGIFAQLFFIAWITLQCVEVGVKNVSVISWLCYFGFTCIAGFVRGEMREMYNIWGSPVDDYFIGVVFYPFCIAQAHMQAESEGKDMPSYFKSADEIIVQMQELINQKGNVHMNMITTDGGGAVGGSASSTVDK